MKALHPKAHAISAFRILKNGEARAYTATTFPQDPWRGCERFLRMARTVGWIRDDHPQDAYAVLDVLDENGDIVQDYAIPDSRSFQQIKKKLNLAVEHA